MTVRITIMGLCIILISQLHAASPPVDFDIVTMRNGDINQGTVAEEFVTIETSAGTQHVPYHQLDHLTVGRHKEPDTLTTKQGETLIGDVKNNDLTMLRVLDTTLPLDLEDILDIRFSFRGINTKKITHTAALETGDGNRLLVNVSTHDFLIKESASMKILNINDISSLDTNTDDDETQQVQVRLKNNETLSGSLLTDKLSFTTNYGENSQLPISDLTSLVFSPQSSNDKIDFSHRWAETPNSLINDTMIDGSPAAEMLVIQAGAFFRGDATGDTDEQPPVKITLGSYAIGVFEVTFNEYDKYCIETRTKCPDDEGWGRGNRPVINVSWKEAMEYTKWLSRKTRKNFRLPTDAEWEYAARAGSKTTYWWGDETGQANANCEGCDSPWDGEKTAVVGKFPPNPFGLHDTAGNVFEWVADCWHDSFAEAPKDGAAIEKPDCGKRVIRGGAWSFPAKEIRSSNRWRDFPSRHSDDTGFRVARDL